MTSLGPIADLLENAGEPGLAAAVRVVEYTRAEGLPCHLETPIRRAARFLREMGHGEFAGAIGTLVFGGYLPTPAPPAFRDPDAVGQRFPAISGAVWAWIEDPEPKLDGLVIELQYDMPTYMPPGISIRMERSAGDRRWTGTEVISGWEMEYSRENMAGRTYRALDVLHRKTIQALRDERAATQGGRS